MKKYFLVFPTYCYLKPNGDSVIQSFGVILHPYGSRRQKQPRQKNNDKSFFPVETSNDIIAGNGK